MARLMNWGGTTPTPTQTPTQTPSRTSIVRTQRKHTRDVNKARRSSPVTKLLMSEGKFTLQQLRDMGFDVSVISNNPTSNSITSKESINSLGNNYPFVGAGANMGSSLTKMIASKNQNENTNPLQPSAGGRGGAVRYGELNNNIGLGQLRTNLGIGQQGIKYTNNQEGNGLDITTGPISGSGAIDQLMYSTNPEGYIQRLMEISALDGGEEGGGSPLYWGGYGSYGGYGGSSYTPFDFFFNLLNWRI